MRKLIIVGLVCLCSVVVHAQDVDSTSQKMKWTNLVQIGQMFDGNEGGITGNFVGSWTSGIQKNNLSVGIELGYNSYGSFKIGSMAFYGKYRLFKNGLSPYGYGTVGYGIPAYFKEESRIDATSSNGGILYSTGVGLDYPMGKVTLLFQFGYKFQKINYDDPNYYYYNDILASTSSFFAPGNSGDGRHTTRKMNRIELKIGMQF